MTDRPAGDDGTTMMELVVGMVLMVICGSVFTAAVVTLNSTSNQAQAITDSTSQNNRAFQTLDRTVRYASAISEPGQNPTTKSWYVELRNTSTGSEVCTQLRLDGVTRQLQSRTWTAANPTTTLTSWTPLASGITNFAAPVGPSTQPFYLVSSGSATKQRLRVLLVASSGPTNQVATSRSSFTLTAVNSTQPPPSGAICQQAGRP